MLRRLVLVGLCCALSGLRADEEFSTAELAKPPSSQRIEALVAEAGQTGWGPIAGRLRPVVFDLYARQQPQTQSWYNLYRWAGLLAQTDAATTLAWINAMNAAKLGNPNMPATFDTDARPLGQRLEPEVQRFLLGSTDFSQQFFGLLSPYDYLPNVLSILNGLYLSDPDRFRAYASLALAIAVVYDMPPPPDWPHAQVSAGLLPRKLPPPGDVFAFFTDPVKAHEFLQQLRRLPASDLKFVVDIAPSFAELAWAQKNVRVTLPELAKLYDLVHYRRERVEQSQFQWTGQSYALPVIYQEGGICIDQAYFASMVGKAKGVPTLLFCGAGLDGRHAWFGYLDANNHWNLDAGRYAEQKFETGIAHDPQTWGAVNDHQLLFATERFRAMPPFQASRLHSDFAAEFVRQLDDKDAMTAARKALTIERRNLEAWEILLACETRAGFQTKAVEATLRDAAVAFQHYPDLEAMFTNRLSRSLRARGEMSAADYEERRIATKYQETRVDVSVQEAFEILQRSMDKDDFPTQMRTYSQVIDTYGKEAGVEFFDKIVMPFIEHLRSAGKSDLALQAALRAQRTLKLEPRSQLEHDVKLLVSTLTPKS